MFLLLLFLQSIKNRSIYLLENQWSARRPQPHAAPLVQSPGKPSPLLSPGARFFLLSNGVLPPEDGMRVVFLIVKISAGTLMHAEFARRDWKPISENREVFFIYPLSLLI
jgi:hypothetical protein